MTSIEHYQDRLDRRVRRVAEQLARTSMVPAALKGKPDDIEAILTVAASVGSPPTAAAVQQFYQPRPGNVAAMGQFQMAKAHDLGHDVWVSDEESSDEVGVAYAKRAGSDRVQRFEFTLAQARKAKLIKPGSAWDSYPGDMLRWRAATRAVRWVAPGAMLGFDSNVAAEAAGEVEVIDSPEPVDVVDAEIVEEHLGETGEDNAWLARFGQALEAVTPRGYTAREVEHAVICHATECETGDASKVHVDQHDAVKKAYVGLREGFLELQRTDNGTFLVEAEPPDAAA